MRVNFKNFNIKKTGIIFGAFLGFLYLLFLIVPFVVSPFVSSYEQDIEKLVKENFGLELKIDKLGIYSTPVLSIGLKAKNIEIKIPDKNDSILNLSHPKGDLKLLPLIAKKVQLGRLSARDLNINLSVKKNGDFEVFDYIPQNNEEQEPIKSLPFGFKLSNHLPDISVSNYLISFKDIENQKSYYTQGENLRVSRFILDKSVKLSAEGKLIFDDRTVSVYDLKINNNIMPNLQLDDIVFPKEVKIENQTETDKVSNVSIPFNITDIFKTVNKNQFQANLKMDVKTSGTFKNPIQRGVFEINNLSVAVNGELLPESYLKMIFKGKKTDIDSIFYTSSDKDEKTQIIGSITSGKKANIDLTFRSNAKFNNAIRLADSIAQSFGYQDLRTLKATGRIDADFNINSDFKRVTSTGYLKIQPSSLKYDLYSASVDNIVADADLMNNCINIKNAGFSVMGHPLKLVGKITADSYADLKLTADNLSIRGLLLALGQLPILKENTIDSGNLSIKAIVKDKFSEMKPDITFKASDINILNIASNTRITLKDAVAKLLLDKSNFSGNVGVDSLALNMDGASVSIPKAKIVMDTKDIKINDTYVLINNSKIDVKGIVKDYLNEKAMNMNISASGNLASSDIMAFIPGDFHSMFPYKGSMPVKILATGNAKNQSVAFDLIANPAGYVQILNIDKFRGKSAKIHSDIKVSGDSLKFENSGIFADNKSVAVFSGGVSHLSNPHLNINVSVPQNISFTIPGLNEHSNITANGMVNIGGTIDNPKLKGKVNIADISIRDIGFELSDIIAHLNGQGISGSGTAEKMVFDGIKASNISADFALKDYTNFYLENISADCFSGKVHGKLSYNIPNFAFATDLSGKGFNSMDAVYGTFGIPKALTGLLSFNAQLTGDGVTDIDIIKSLKGNINFNITDGRFVSIGKWENLVSAQNVTSNSILKSAISAMSTVGAIQETDKFKTITGSLSLAGGNATLHNILVSGPLMSYYVKGVYNILANTAYLTILGRLDSKIVSYLGPLGQLSLQKLVSYIPGLGQSTAKMLQLLTQPPSEEELALIPALSSGSKEYRDFKTIFNGSVEKASSVKSFRWLSVCDTTKMNLAQDGKDAVKAVKDNVNSQIDSMKNSAQNVKNNVDNIVNTQKQNIETQKKAVQQAKQDINNIKQNAGTSVNNLGNLLKNAALNANKKMESPAPSSESATQKTETNTANTASSSVSKTESESTQTSTETNSSVQNSQTSE